MQPSRAALSRRARTSRDGSVVWRCGGVAVWRCGWRCLLQQDSPGRILRGGYHRGRIIGSHRVPPPPPPVWSNCVARWRSRSSGLARVDHVDADMLLQKRQKRHRRRQRRGLGRPRHVFLSQHPLTRHLLISLISNRMRETERERREREHHSFHSFLEGAPPPRAA